MSLTPTTSLPRALISSSLSAAAGAASSAQSATIAHLFVHGRIVPPMTACTMAMCYSTFVPESLITLSHFSTSDRTKAPNSSGLAMIGVAPSSANCDFIFGEPSAVFISRLSLSMIAAGDG